jgi:hypothetical protein
MAILPTLIDQAEQRCYRDLDLLYLTTTHNITLVPNTNNVDISLYQPQVLILEDVWVILPAGVTNPDLAEIVPVYPASFEWVRMVYGNSAQKGPPNYYFMISDHLVGWGPFPDAAYTVIIKGKYRPAPLYSAAPNNGTQSTVLTTLVPDLFLAAAMSAAAAYQHNWGAQSDDPRSAMSWETSYQTLLVGAQIEEMRKKMHGWMQMTSETPPMPMRPGTPGPT